MLGGLMAAVWLGDRCPTRSRLEQEHELAEVWAREEQAEEEWALEDREREQGSDSWALEGARAMGLE
jgi:hypothetical protein